MRPELLKTIVVALSVMLLVVGCGDSPAPVASPPSTPAPVEVVRFGYTPVVASLPIFVAKKENYFASVGIKAEEVVFTNSNDMVNALVAGQVDVLPAVSLVPLLHLEAQQPGVVRLFSHSRMRPTKAFDSIVVMRDSPIEDLHGLAGRKVGVFPGTSAMNMFKAFLAKHGVDASRVTLVQLAPPAQLSSLDSGAIDALFTYEPVTTVALRDGRHRPLFGSVYADLLNPCPIGSSAVSRAFERSKPEAARRAIEAIDRSVAYMRSHPNESKALLPQFAPISPEIATSVNLVDVTLSTENDIANLQQFTDLLVRVGELPRPLDVNLLVSATR